MGDGPTAFFVCREELSAGVLVSLRGHFFAPARHAGENIPVGQGESPFYPAVREKFGLHLGASVLE
jgi:hypothetical protein